MNPLAAFNLLTPKDGESGLLRQAVDHGDILLAFSRPFRERAPTLADTVRFIGAG